MTSVSVKTNQLFPSYHSNRRSVFDLPKAVYLNTWRLTDIGSTTNNPQIFYQTNVGCNGLIQSITLYSNNQVIDQLRNAHSFLAFQQLRNANAENYGVEHFNSGTRFGFTVEKYSSVADVHKAILGFRGDPFIQPGTEPEQQGWLNLQRALGYLRADAVVPPVNGLRLVIEWRTDGQNVYRGNTQANTTVTINEPRLIVDEIVDDKTLKDLANKSVSVPFVSMERDSVLLDGTGTKTYRLNGFQNKVCRRMLLVNELPPTQANDVAAEKHVRDIKSSDASVSQHDETTQVRLNGGNVFPSSGIRNENHKLDMCSGAWGDINICQGFQFDGLDEVHNFLETSNAVNSAGRTSYGGWTVNDRVNDLEITYTRATSAVPKDGSGAADSQMTQACWAEVQKVMSCDKFGNVAVAYA